MLAASKRLLWSRDPGREQPGPAREIPLRLDQDMMRQPTALSTHTHTSFDRLFPLPVGPPVISTNLPDNYNSALFSPVPTVGDPTELVADRVDRWRVFIKAIIAYLIDLDAAAHTNARMADAAAAKAEKAVLAAPAGLTVRWQKESTNPGAGMRARADSAQSSGGGSDRAGAATAGQIVSLGGVGLATAVLAAHDRAAAQASDRSRSELMDAAALLNQLRTDLGLKKKEIRAATADFRVGTATAARELAYARRAVAEVGRAISGAAKPDRRAGPAWWRDGHDPDPAVMTARASAAVSRSVAAEQAVHAAYLRLEAASRELDDQIIGEVRAAMAVITSRIDQQARLGLAAIAALENGPMAERSDAEWDRFVAAVCVPIEPVAGATGTTKSSDRRQPGWLVPPHFPVREPGKVTFPGHDDRLSRVIRTGMVERKSKYLARYSRRRLVLTATHLHDFDPTDWPESEADKDPEAVLARLALLTPSMSLALRDRAVRVGRGCAIAAAGSASVNAPVELDRTRTSQDSRLDDRQSQPEVSRRRWPARPTVLASDNRRFLLKSTDHHYRQNGELSPDGVAQNGHRRIVSSTSKPVRHRPAKLSAPSWVFRLEDEATMSQWAVAVACAIADLESVESGESDHQGPSPDEPVNVAVAIDSDGELEEMDMLDAAAEKQNPPQPSSSDLAGSSSHSRTRSVPVQSAN